MGFPKVSLGDPIKKLTLAFNQLIEMLETEGSLHIKVADTGNRFRSKSLEGVLYELLDYLRAPFYVSDGQNIYGDFNTLELNVQNPVVLSTTREGSTVRVTYGVDSKTSAEPNTVVSRDSNADITARRFISTATGISPLSISSSILVPNLNADLLDGYHASTTPSSNAIPVCDGLGLLTSFVSPTLSRTVYVDQVNGDDNNSGTSSSPFKTLQKAVNSVPPGGTVTIRLLSDYTMAHNEAAIITWKYVILDLNGKTLSTTYGVSDNNAIKGILILTNAMLRIEVGSGMIVIPSNDTGYSISPHYNAFISVRESAGFGILQIYIGSNVGGNWLEISSGSFYGIYQWSAARPSFIGFVIYPHYNRAAQIASGSWLINALNAPLLIYADIGNDNYTGYLKRPDGTLLTLPDVITGAQLYQMPGINISRAGWSYSVTTVSSNTTLGSSHHIVFVDASGDSRTITLPSALSLPGRQYIIKKIDSSSNAVIITPQSGETIDGQSSLSLTTQYECVTIVSDGSNWQIITR